MALKYKVYTVFFIIVVGLGYATYRFALTEEARQSIKEALQSVSKGYVSIKEVLESYTGILMEDDQALPNVQETEREWKAIGF